MQNSTPLPYSPTVRIHQSSPAQHTTSQHHHHHHHHQQPMLAPSPFVGGGYEGYPTYLSALPKGFKDRSIHKRTSSGSSIASAGPPSPLSHSTMNPRIVTSDATFSPSYEFDFTPQHATSVKSMPNSEPMMFQPNGAYGAVDMRRIQSAGTDERAYAGAQSVSSMSHDSPATPQTNYGTEYEDSKVYRGKNDNNVDMISQYLLDLGYPTTAYTQSLQDVFPNQDFSSQMAYPQMQQRTHRPSMMQDRLHAAQQDHLRINSPSSNPREKSPFKPSSNYNMQAPVQPPHPQQQPQQQQQQMPVLTKQRTSISPKELMLDEHDIDESSYGTPLFQDQSQYAHRRTKSTLANSYIPFSQESSIGGIPQQYPFVSQQSRAETQSGLHETPDFPAHLLSMESTTDDGPSEPSSQQAPVKVKHETSQSQRPVDTSSDAGTYSCTYHGCTLRFDSPVKLQKHKREGHRQHSPSSANQAARNSQAGPHRCERINPSTGKPCNSIFSRPYDLTRHEDTIHNSRKQKVRCHLCTEEKTFSRNDALTRHMRVVHPDVDWVGKQKRKSHK